MSSSAGGSKMMLLIFLIPFFVAIGHDFYMSRALNPARAMRLETFDIDPEAYQASDFGYVILKYMPDVYNQAKDMVPPVTWDRWVDPALRVYTFIIALIPAALYFIWLVVSYVVDTVWRMVFSGRGGGNAASTRTEANYSSGRMFGDEPSNKFKYKRR